MPRSHTTARICLVALILVALVAAMLAYIARLVTVEDHPRTPDSASDFPGKALLIVDMADGEVRRSVNPDMAIVPASLAKLFVIDYALTVLDPHEVVTVTPQALHLVKPGSSLAHLKPGRYRVSELIAAMVIPSGNDAAYALADCVTRAGSDGAADSPQQRQEVFLTGLAAYMAARGYHATEIHDAAGYDNRARTSAADVRAVAQRLLEYPWFAELIRQPLYSLVTADGHSYQWRNTNKFLDPASEFYNPGVIGMKTGSLGDDYHLVTYYRGTSDYLVIALGAPSDRVRYQGVAALLDALTAGDRPHQHALAGTALLRAGGR